MVKSSTQKDDAFNGMVFMWYGEETEVPVPDEEEKAREKAF